MGDVSRSIFSLLKVEILQQLLMSLLRSLNNCTLNKKCFSSLIHLPNFYSDEYQPGDSYRIHVMEQISCTFCEIVGRKISAIMLIKLAVMNRNARKNLDETIFSDHWKCNQKARNGQLLIFGLTGSQIIKIKSLSKSLCL